MKQAILIPYAVDQNEPSKPIPRIYTLPDDQHERNDILRQAFIEHVCEVDEDEISINRKGSEYGDIVVSSSDDLFMFVTYIKTS